MTFPSDVEIDDDLANRLSALLRELLETERQSITGADDARREELRGLIEERETVLNNDEELDAEFGEYITALSETERPQGRVQVSRVFADWEGGIRSELVGWKNELAELENQPIDKQAIFNSARNKALHLLRRETHDADLMPGIAEDGQSFADAPLTVNWLEDNWFNLSELGNTVPVINRRPSAMQFPNGVEKPVRSWRVLYTSVVEWLEEAGHRSAENIPTEIANLMHHYSGESSRELKNGRFINVNLNADAIIGNSRRFVEACREEPGQFHVQLR